MLLLAVPVGLLIGLSLGALGGGGSILTVPALVYLLAQDPHDATTTSLIIVGITAVAGAAAHTRARSVAVVPGLAFGVVGIAGSYAGSRLSSSVDPDVLLLAFSGLVLLAAAAMGRRVVHGRSDADRVSCVLDRQPGGRLRCAAKVAGAATAVGLLTGFFGVGGGFVVVPALVLALGLDMRLAVGTSLLVIAINSAAALLSRLGTSVSLDWTLVGVFTGAAVAGSVAGRAIAGRVDQRRLEAAFAVLLVLVGLYTAARSLPAVV